MKVTNAQYTTTANATIRCEIDGIRMQVPTDPANTHFIEILKQVKEGKLTIKDAD
tara:strand:+ start:230 stop:394 length:165 start_codon:yes stop_codon:yes gene_type:complete